MNMYKYFHVENIFDDAELHRNNNIQEVLFYLRLNNICEGKWSIEAVSQ